MAVEISSAMGKGCFGSKMPLSYIYIYIYIYVYIHTYIYIYIIVLSLSLSLSLYCCRVDKLPSLGVGVLIVHKLHPDIAGPWTPKESRNQRPLHYVERTREQFDSS